MKTGFLSEVGRVEVKEFDRVSPDKDEVLIKVKAAGICGSDVHAYHGSHPFRKPPMILGHEVAGEVVETGAEVTRFQKGDRVTVEPQKACGTCTYCHEGMYNCCLSKTMAGVKGWLGSFAEYFVAQEQRVYPLPESMSYEIGSLAEPLAVGVHAVRTSRFKKGESAIVLGAGPIGLMAAVSLQAVDPTHVFCTDINPFRLIIADKLGIQSIHADNESVEEKIREFIPIGLDVVILTVTSAKVLDQGLRLVRRGGRLIIVSVFTEEIPVKMGLVQVNEIEVKGSNTYVAKDFHGALKILSERSKEIEQVITRRVKLEDIDAVMKGLTQRQNRDLKVIVKP